MNKSIGIIGYGLIGQCAAEMLRKQWYSVTAYDINDVFGATKITLDNLDGVVKKHDAIIAATPFTVNKTIADLCLTHRVAYFDLTEDVETTHYIQTLAYQDSRSFFMPQCGLAPGVVGLIAKHLVDQFRPTYERPVSNVHVRVGALPKYTNNRLKYNLTWSVDGLINEYLRQGEAIRFNQLTVTKPLEELEHIVIEGVEYEAFNTSGGIGTLLSTLKGFATNVNYKTIRYCGHLKELTDLTWTMQTQEKLVSYFKQYVPYTADDVVVIYIEVNGQDSSGKLVNRQYVKKIEGHGDFSAIQVTTAAGVCLAVDWWARGKEGNTKTFAGTHDISWDFFQGSPFTTCYK